MFRSFRKPLAVAAMTLGSYGIADAASGGSTQHYAVGTPVTVYVDSSYNVVSVESR